MPGLTSGFEGRVQEKLLVWMAVIRGVGEQRGARGESLERASSTKGEFYLENSRHTSILFMTP